MDEDVMSSDAMNRLTFPYHVLQRASHPHISHETPATRLVGWKQSPCVSFHRLVASVFPNVLAAENSEDVGKEKEDEEKRYSRAIESLAHAYIERETGWDRLHMMFEKDHRGKQDLELSCIQVALVQVFVLTFFCKYVPVARFARKEFIREHQATVFRTRFEALRRLQDYTFLKAGAEAASFSTKITVFSASFLFLSSMISTYRNKSSLWEYTIAAGVTGGLARLSMGLKGCLVGCLVGSVLGSVIGLVGYSSLSAYDMTQELRHLEAVRSRLEVARSVEGDTQFQTRLQEVMKEDKSLTNVQST